MKDVERMLCVMGVRLGALVFALTEARVITAARLRDWTLSNIDLLPISVEEKREIAALFPEPAEEGGDAVH